jgi:DNA repair exonuclease SbcCD nuclease subunit
MKFIHTADWQLGLKAAHVGDAGARVREERLLAARRVGEAARTHSADFILIAGDVFEDNGVDRALVQKVADMLAGFDLPVYLIPGNHDPAVPGSVWDHPVWKSLPDVHVLGDEKPVEVPGGLLFPCPAREKYSRRDPTAWIGAGGEGGIRIGLAHGTVEGIRQDEPDYPVARDAAQRAGLDYLALGHWHSTAFYSGEDGAVRMAYSGTHEATRFAERDSGNVLVVVVSGAGAPPAVTPVPMGGLKWQVIEEDLRQPGDLAGVRNRIESLEHPESTLVELRLGGLLAAEDSGEVSRIDEILKSRFLFARLDASRLRPSPQDEGWLTRLPHGILRDVAAGLSDLADPQFSGPRPEGATPEVAARALLELYALAAEVAP